MSKAKLIITDFETGGLKYKEHPITQAAFVVIDPKSRAILDTYETFVKPYQDLVITPKALEASRVTMEQIESGVDYLVLMAKMIELAKKHTVGKTKPIFIGHNFTFDIDFAEQLFRFKSKNLYDFFDRFFWCTMRMMKDYERKEKADAAYDLTACCNRFGIKLKSAHGALADCYATKDLFTALTKNWIPKVGVDTETNEPAEEIVKSRKYFELP